MPDNSMIRVTLIGEAASDWVACRQGGKVLVAVTGATYLLSEQGELFWLAAEASPMHRRCLRVTSLPRLQAGDACHIREQTLAASNGMLLDLQATPVWKAPSLSPSEATAFTKLSGVVNSTYQQLSAQHEPAGFGVLIPAILRTASRQTPARGVNPGDLILRTAWPAVEKIVLAWLAQDTSRMLEHAGRLAGLGEGLTPSGDDFLGGFFFCIQLLHRTYPGILVFPTGNYSDFFPDFISDFILQYKQKTNLISDTLLKDLAAGQGLEPLHRFANALLMGRQVEALIPSARELLSVGHSTGWDQLTGFLAGMSITFQQ